MRKRIIGLTALAAVLTLSTGITAFAGSWKEDAIGRYYENDDGTRPVYADWFTDPADGNVYHMDPDGYVMINAEVGSFRTDDNGRRIEKTEAELKQEAERKEELKKRPNPAKGQLHAEDAGNAVKAGTSTTAVGTVRNTYQTEMSEFAVKHMTNAKDARTSRDVKPVQNEDNTLLTYAFQNPDGYQFLKATIWKGLRETSPSYKPYSFELAYHFDSAAADTEVYNEAYNQLTVAALGSSAGPAALEAIQTERSNGTTNFDQSGTTDTGNSYSVRYRNGLVTIYVTCSGVDPNAATEQAAPAEDAAAEAAPEAEPQQTATSSTIVAGSQQTAA